MDFYGTIGPACADVKLLQQMVEAGMTGIRMNQESANLAKMNKALPVLFVSGAKDPVGGMAKGVLKTIDAFKRTGLRNITIHIYPEGRHEMLNEVNRSEVYGDVLRWLEAL